MIINEETYQQFSGSAIPTVRNDNGSLLSISGSTSSIDLAEYFFEIRTIKQFVTSSENVLDFEFSELLSEEQNTLIPSNSVLITENEYNSLLEENTNLKDDLLVSKSVYENELDIEKSQTTVIIETVKSINSSTFNILTQLENKYSNDQNIKNEFTILKGLAIYPIDFYIQNTGSLFDRKTSFVNSEFKLENGNPIKINETHVTYSLSFNGNFLENIFSSDHDNILLQAEVGQLRSANNTLLEANLSLTQELERLNELLANISGSGFTPIIFPESDYARVRVVLGGNNISSINTTIENSDEYNFKRIIKKGKFEIVDKFPPGDLKIRFNRTIMQHEIVRYIVFINTDEALTKKPDINNFNFKLNKQANITVFIDLGSLK